MPTVGRRRALGQHFLKDTQISETIAKLSLEQVKKSGCRALLEIGPGKGALTQPLLQIHSQADLLKKIILVERDQKLASEWRSRLEDRPGPVTFSVECADFLDLAEENWLSLVPLFVVSNLPYSAGTAILTRLARHAQKIPSMILMFQAEVAKRLRAELHTKERGSLSIWIQNKWDVSKLIAVPPRAFAPPPEVNSEVVLLVRRDQQRIPVSNEDEALFENLLKTCFAHRRKMLRASLRGHSRWQNALEVSGVDGTKRPEALEWDEWSRMFHAGKKQSRKD